MTPSPEHLKAALLAELHPADADGLPLPDLDTLSLEALTRVMNACQRMDLFRDGVDVQGLAAALDSVGTFLPGLLLNSGQEQLLALLAEQFAHTDESLPPLVSRFEPFDREWDDPAEDQAPVLTLYARGVAAQVLHDALPDIEEEVQRRRTILFGEGLSEAEADALFQVVRAELLGERTQLPEPYFLSGPHEAASGAQVWHLATGGAHQDLHALMKRLYVSRRAYRTPELRGTQVIGGGYYELTHGQVQRLVQAFQGVPSDGA